MQPWPDSARAPAGEPSYDGARPTPAPLGRVAGRCHASCVAGRRWDGDERGEGVADAGAFAGAAGALLEAMRSANWVAEAPEAHLLPHLRRACKSLPFELVAAGTSADGTFDVELHWTGETRGQAEVRAAIFALVGSFAELSTYVRQRNGGPLAFEVVTGFLEGESVFSPHGHTVRLSVNV